MKKIQSKGDSKSFTFGGCRFDNTSPSVAQLSPSTKTLNIRIGFEDALKLNLAVDECVRKLNSYKRNSADGKRTALNISVKLSEKRIEITPAKLTSHA